MKFIILLLPMLAFGAGKGHGSVASLAAPVLNVGILIAFLIWKLKAPLREMFLSSSKEIKETLDRAAAKAKEAKILMDAQNQKMANLDNEIGQIKTRSVNEVKSFEDEIVGEYQGKTNKLKENANLKIEAEKKLAIEKLNNSLLDEVIVNAKKKLREDKGLSEKASERLLRGLN